MSGKTLFILALVLLCGLIIAPVVQAQQEKPVVRGYLFYLEENQGSSRVRTETIPSLYREFGQQVQIMAIETSDEANYQWWLACKKAYGVSDPDADVPALFVGDRYLIGQAAIAQQAHALIQEVMGQGGIDYPDVSRPGGSLEPTVRFMFFWSSTCGHCKYVKENVFPLLKEKYGDRVQWVSYSVEETENYVALLRLEEMAGLPKERRGGVPVVFIGDEYSAYALFIGSGDIPTYLPPTVDWFMSIGGVDLPGWKDDLFVPLPEPTATAILEPTGTSTPAPAVATLTLTPTRVLPTATTLVKQQATHVPGTVAPALVPPQSTPVGLRPTRVSPTATPEPVTQTRPDNGPLIHMAYFAQVGCSECDRVSIALKHLQMQFPNLVIHEMDILEDLAVNLCLSERLDVRENQRHDAPAVFVGTDYMVDEDIYYDSLVEMVSKYVTTGADPVWETCDTAVRLPPLPPWWAVIVPGLIDGINPCAFATIIFFVSYLSIVRRRGQEILMVGIAFTLAVFLAYLGFGIILRELLPG
ncbi:MAG: hypothetical protein JXA89_15565 [Anaerolineae bacterium]|nr:hypothetical protein [Anaerolineae bacterium]